MSNDTSSYLYPSPRITPTHANLTHVVRDENSLYIQSDKNAVIDGCAFVYAASTRVIGKVTIKNSHDLRLGEDFRCTGDIEIIGCGNISLADKTHIGGNLIIKNSKNIHLPRKQLRLGKELLVDEESATQLRGHCSCITASKTVQKQILFLRKFMENLKNTNSSLLSSTPIPIKQNTSSLTLESQ